MDDSGATLFWGAGLPGGAGYLRGPESSRPSWVRAASPCASGQREHLLRMPPVTHDLVPARARGPWRRLRTAPRAVRLALLLTAGGAAVLVACVVPGLARRAGSGVVDTRAFLGLPNALDVLSNLPFALAGGLGLARLGRVPPAQRPAAALTFLAVALATFGSAWYHLAPSRERLLVDRVPITLAFVALFAWVLGDRLGARVGRLALAPLLLLGAGALWRWHTTGELLAYALVQAVPLLLIPCLLVLFDGELRPARFAWALAFYAAGKLCELYDRELFELGTLASGHTWKHLLSAAACFALVPGTKVAETDVGVATFETTE